MSVYHQQKSFIGRHKKWAGSLRELGLALSKWPGVVAAPKIELTTGGYVATVAIKTSSGRTRHYQVRADSKLTLVDRGQAQPE
jgi:hypothetical protein